jgi:UDP-N-acetylglucosamine acyltransferase
MSTRVHPTALVDPGAWLDDDVVVGPFCIVGSDVRIGKGTRLEANVHVYPGTTLGQECRMFAGAKLGGPPQDLKYRGEKSLLIIGDRNIIREEVTIHRASGEGMATRIGSDNMLMAYSHVGHNCELGNHISITNQSGISGHVVIEDRVIISGLVGVHQYVRIGRLAIVGGFSKVVQDVPPFMMADGRPAKILGLNVIGLRRAGVPLGVRSGLKQAYKLIYRSGLNLSQAIETVESEVEATEERDYLLSFLNLIREGNAGRANDPSGSHRGRHLETGPILSQPEPAELDPDEDEEND